MNFCGSILTLQPLPIPENGYLDFDRGALVCRSGYGISLGEFMRQYCQKGA